MKIISHKVCSYSQNPPPTLFLIRLLMLLLLLLSTSLPTDHFLSSQTPANSISVIDSISHPPHLFAVDSPPPLFLSLIIATDLPLLPPLCIYCNQFSLLSHFFISSSPLFVLQFFFLTFYTSSSLFFTFIFSNKTLSSSYFLKIYCWLSSSSLLSNRFCLIPTFFFSFPPYFFHSLYFSLTFPALLSFKLLQELD